LGEGGVTGSGITGNGSSCTGSKMISRRMGPICPARMGITLHDTPIVASEVLFDEREPQKGSCPGQLVRTPAQEYVCVACVVVVTITAVPTTRRTNRRAPAKRRPAKRRPAGARRPARGQALRDRAAEQLRGHVIDVVAVGLAALGSITALALATDLVGPVGRLIDVAATSALGRGAGMLPVGCFAVAVLLLWSRPFLAEETGAPDLDAAPVASLRIGMGVSLVLLGIVGLLHLGGGSPSLDGSMSELRTAGGFAGAVVGGPLRAGLGVVGAVIVLLAATVLGVLLAPGVGVRRALHGIASGTVVLVRALHQAFELHAIGDDSLREGQPADDVGAASPRRSRLYDELADPMTFETEAEPVAEEAELVDLEEEIDDEVAALPPAPKPPVLAPMIDPAVLQSPGAWKLPPSTLLRRSNGRAVDPRIVDEGGRVLEATLQEFGVDARLVGRTIGPTVTRYELELGAGVKVSRVTGLSKEIAYSMASHDVRILAPIPGRSAIGVEVPNKQRQLVTLGDILATDDAAAASHPLEVGLGRDIAGRSQMANLATFPHVLIAGATGAGKSSCINSIVTSILMRSTPDQVRLILVDPKRVELGVYNGLPHLLTEVVTNPKKAANALEWAVREMDMRYELLAEVGVRDITGYNAMYDRGELPTTSKPDPALGKTYERLPFIVLVVDELNDLMMVAARDVEASICRVAQMARAVGIHLVIATQRPSVDVITGVIKANVPSRLAFSVSSLADSRVILDQPGAEKLIGQGDMLVLSASTNRAQRVQGAWVDEECVRKVVAHWRRQVSAPSYIEGLQGDDSPSGGRAGDDVDDDDELLGEAMELVVRSGLGSTSMLQRKLRVGFARAGRLIDLLERRGVVGPSEGSKARAVLMTVEEFEQSHDRV
jgi:S-DNA-T family DNA segregation ATPase FtsK/SpoIIIE